MIYRKFLSNRTGASKRDIWTRAGKVIAPSLKYYGHVEKMPSDSTDLISSVGRVSGRHSALSNGIG